MENYTFSGTLKMSINKSLYDPEDYSTEQEDNYDDGNIMNRSLVKVFFLLAYIIVFLLCLIGNSMVLICIIWNRSMRTVTNFFLANLATADLLVGIFCVCQNAANFVLFEHGTWPFGRLLCHAYVYILHMIPNSSAGILVLLSVERFIAVIRPMLVHHLMTKSVLILCTALVWSLSAMMNIPYLIAVQYMELYNSQSNQYYGICTRRHFIWSDINVLQLVSTINLMVWYVLPLTLLLTIYATIGLVLIRTTEDDSVIRTSQMGRVSVNSNAKTKPIYSLLKTKENLQPLQKRSFPGALQPHNRKLSQLSPTRKLSQLNQTGADDTLEPNNHIRKLPKIELVDSRRRVIRLCAVIVLAFAVLSLPRYIYLTWSVWRETNAPRCLNCLSALIQPTTFLLMFFASGINPILYAFLSQRFRAAIKDTFHFRKRQQQRKEQMMLMLRNHRLSEQGDRETYDMLGQSMSSNLQNGRIDLNRREKKENCNRKKTPSVAVSSARIEESTILETTIDSDGQTTTTTMAFERNGSLCTN